jgi:hypothetical protein
MVLAKATPCDGAEFVGIHQEMAAFIAKVWGIEA